MFNRKIRVLKSTTILILDHCVKLERTLMIKLNYILIFLVIFATSCQSQNTENKKKFSHLELEQDFNQLVNELETHPQINTFILKKDWISLIKRQSEKLKKASTIEEFYSICLPIVAKVGCGHTNLYNLEYNAATKEALVYLPYKFIIEDNQLYVIENLSSNSLIPLGSKITSINGKPIKDIINFILESMPADGYNKSYKKRMASKGFTYYYHALFGINDYNYLSYSFEGETKDLDFKCSELIPSKSLIAKDTKPLDFRIDQENNTAIITIKTFSFYNNVSHFEKFINTSFNTIKEYKLDNVILDLRGNQGGDPYCSSYLLRAISKKPIQYYKDDKDYPELIQPQKELGFTLKNKPYILIDGLGFSSTGHLAALIKEHDLGIFIGEELGSTYSCNGGQRNTTLTNTKLFLQVGQKTVDVMVNASDFNKSIGILPDISIITDYKSIIEKRDVVLENVFEIIKIN